MAYSIQSGLIRHPTIFLPPPRINLSLIPFIDTSGMQIHKHGFTLIELSIVIVIIGLVAGGVLFGKDMIRVAEIRRIYTEKEKIILAVNAFRAKYNCLPGDCAAATQFFGADPEVCDLSGSVHTPKMATCNGDGNGRITVASSGHEWFKVWQHFAAASLWPGLFRGSGAPLGKYDETVLPPVSIARSHYWLLIDDTGTESLNMPLYNHVLLFQPYDFGTSGIMTPSEAMSFDSKFDDGLPASGAIQAQTGTYLINCTSPDTTLSSPNAIYLSTQTGKNCSVLFTHIGF